jgi:hypothetical protein
MNPWCRRCSPAVDALGPALPAIRSLEHAGFLRQAAVGRRGDGRPALRWDVKPVLIGVTLAEIAEIRRDRVVHCTLLIGGALAQTAETLTEP